MKKNLKALVVLALAFAMVFTMAGCGGGSEGGSEGGGEASEGGKVLNIWCWNDEFQSRFNEFYPEVEEVAKDNSTTTLKDGTTVKWTINPNENNNYQDKLDEALLKQADAAADDKIDIFLVEADYALKYVDADVTMDVEALPMLVGPFLLLWCRHANPEKVWVSLVDGVDDGFVILVGELRLVWWRVCHNVKVRILDGCTQTDEREYLLGRAHEHDLES